MKDKNIFKIIDENYSWLLVFVGFCTIFIFSWLDEAIDFPHLLFNVQKTPFNWREALLESLLITIVGVSTLLCLSRIFNKKRKAEKELIKAQKELKFEKQKLEEVLNIDCEISSILGLNQLISFIIKQSVKLLEVKRCSLMFLDFDKNELIFKGSEGLEDEVIKNNKIIFGERIAGFVAKDGKPILIKNIDHSEFAHVEKIGKYTSKSFMIVPIILHNKVVGVVNVSEKESDELKRRIFTNIDLKVLCSIVHQSAVAIENAKYYQKLEYLTHTDDLTELFNHRHFVKTLDIEIKRSQRYLRPLSLLMLDVDNFKYYNDTYGHLDGDYLLKEIGVALMSVSRDVDICCRYAGDEFVVILPETDIAQAEKFAQKIKGAIDKIDYKEKITASFGAAEYNNYEHGRIDLVRKADQILHEEKRLKKLKNT